jgi:DNA polymerase-3 subunit delta'
MSIPVATVREMRRDLYQKAPQAGKRVVLIEQMDRMLMTSADALLKLVEEPPAQTLIIITTSHAEKLLPTIISRCRQVRFARLPEAEIAGYLTGHTDLSDAKAALLARLSRGSLGHALYLAAGENEQDREVAKLIFKGMFQIRPIDLIAEAADVLPYNDRFRLNRIIGVWQTLFRDIIFLKNGEQSERLVNVDFIGELEKIAARDIRQEHLLDIPAFLGSVIDDINLNVDTYSAIGAVIIDVRRRLGLDSPGE